MRLTRRFFLAALSVAALAGPVWADGPLKVVATTGMIADTVSVIGGDRIEVRGLMEPGVDPHAYRQTRTDIRDLTRADLVLWNGLYLEAQMEDFLNDLAGRLPVVAVGEAVPADQRIAHDDYANRADPHVWMDPDLWRMAAAEMTEALIAVDPEGQAVYRANAEAYLSDLERLSTYARDVLISVPEAQRVLLTAHDAFNYFGRAYGYEVIGIQGISTESEAGLNRIGELVDLLVDRRIEAVFVESSVSDRNIRALIEGAAARGHTVRIGGELYSDAMGEPGTYEGTYLGMIDHNATVIAGALGGLVPERGMDGRLNFGM